MLRHPVRWLRDHPLTADAVLAAVFGTMSLVGLLTVDSESVSSSNRDADVFGVLLTVGIWFAAAFRRCWPEPIAWIVAALTLPYWILDYVDSGTSAGVLILAYTLAAHVDRPRSLHVGLVIGVVLVGVMVAGTLAEEEELPAVTVVANTVVFATAWTIGDSVRNRRAYLAEVEARAERAERDRELAAERAVQDERVRIAREFHDIVAHSVSVMVVQATAARRVLDHDPAQTEESLAVIERTGRNALNQLRRMLGMLRSEPATPANEPQPTARDTTTLVEQWRDAGLDVSLTVEGSPGDLPPGVGLTVYRVVQEALTNVMKHAGPARAEVHVCYSGPVVIEVADDGRGAPVDTGLPSAGQGIIGMRERVELFGGELHVGPRPGGGFRVRATVPVASTAPV